MDKVKFLKPVEIDETLKVSKIESEEVTISSTADGSSDSHLKIDNYGDIQIYSAGGTFIKGYQQLDLESGYDIGLITGEGDGNRQTAYFGAEDVNNWKNEVGAKAAVTTLETSRNAIIKKGSAEGSTISGGAYNGIDPAATAAGAHSEGGGTQAKSDGAHTEGVNTIAGRMSEADTANTTKIGQIIAPAATELGMPFSTTADQQAAVMKLAGFGAHAEGFNTQALGTSSHSEGNATKALANATHAEGDTTEATGEASHSEGYNTKAVGNQSHAEGLNTQAHGNASHTEGRHTKTAAEASGAHAEGISTEANIDGAHAEGVETKTTSNSKGQGQHVQGRWNVVDTAGDYAHIVGGGISDEYRRNIHTIDWSGNAYFEGNITTHQIQTGYGHLDLVATEYDMNGDGKTTGTRLRVRSYDEGEIELTNYDESKWVSISIDDINSLKDTKDLVNNYIRKGDDNYSVHFGSADGSEDIRLESNGGIFINAEQQIQLESLYDISLITGEGDGEKVTEYFGAKDIRNFKNKADKTVATQTTDGLMSAADKKKLDGLSETAKNATNVTTNINGKAISSIFESDGTTVKHATYSSSAYTAGGITDYFTGDATDDINMTVNASDYISEIPSDADIMVYTTDDDGDPIIANQNAGSVKVGSSSHADTATTATTLSAFTSAGGWTTYHNYDTFTGTGGIYLAKIISTEDNGSISAMMFIEIPSDFSDGTGVTFCQSVGGTALLPEHKVVHASISWNDGDSYVEVHICERRPDGTSVDVGEDIFIQVKKLG